MLRIKDSLGTEPITFHYMNALEDRLEIRDFVLAHSALGIDTESTGLNCYRGNWQLRTMQVGNANHSYVIPAANRGLIRWIMKQPMNWIGHNGPHDIRCIDSFLGYETGVTCAGETYLPAHYSDSRPASEGGIGHGLKEQAIAHISRDAGKWEVALKKVFKQIEIPIPGAIYKSGKRKGQPRMRKARLAEGWGLIDLTNPVYIAYAAADPLLTYRLWKYYQPVVKQFHELYQFDKAVQLAADKLNRRAMLLDRRYTQRLDDAYMRKAGVFIDQAAEFGCANINSGQQIAATIAALGGRLTTRTPTGQYKTDDKILRGLVAACGGEYSPVKDFIHCVLGAKQLLKRRENYTQAMLREVDERGRVHPSINTMGARTTRMSVSGPPLQQLPTSDREADAE